MSGSQSSAAARATATTGNAGSVNAAMPNIIAGPPANTGKPEVTGKPGNSGKSAVAGKPANSGKSAVAGKPDDIGPKVGAGRLSAADQAFVAKRQAKMAERQSLRGNENRGNAQRSAAGLTRAGFANSRVAFMRSMVANSGPLSGGGAMVSNRSALDLFKSTGSTLATGSTVAQYVNSMVLESMSIDKGTGIYATLAKGMAAESGMDVLA